MARIESHTKVLFFQLFIIIIIIFYYDINLISSIKFNGDACVIASMEIIIWN